MAQAPPTKRLNRPDRGRLESAYLGFARERARGRRGRVRTLFA
ncbi:MAG: hypothetical protein NZ533_11645 [Casimicrobiaceae bacterium]|nr:hypothetical protein [Casimicrobiaceae bacterium]